MSDTTRSTRPPTVTLQLPKSVPPLIVYAQGIVKRMTGNTSLPNPAPPLTEVTSAINDLQTAEAGALARTKGAVAVRNAKRTALILLLQQLRGYIQTTADAESDERDVHHPELGGRGAQDAGAPRARIRRQAGEGLRNCGDRGRDGGPARVVRMAVQHRRGQDVDHRAEHPSVQDHHRRPHPRSECGVQVQGRDQDRRRRLEPADVTPRSLSCRSLPRLVIEYRSRFVIQ